MTEHRKGKQARSRYFTQEQIDKGFGLLLLEATDFARPDRDRLVEEIVAAYEAGRLNGETLEAARQVASALRAPCATLEALRWFTRADGREMVERIRTAAAAVPALTSLVNWIAI